MIFYKAPLSCPAIRIHKKKSGLIELNFFLVKLGPLALFLLYVFQVIIRIPVY